MAIKKHPENDLVASDAEAGLAAQTKEILGKLGDRTYEWLLITKQHIFPCEAQVHLTRESLVGDLGGALTCHCEVVAIYHCSRELPQAEVEPLLVEAVNGLGSISRARAKGRL